MRKLIIDMQELVMAFEDHSPEMNHYLDLATGAVVRIDPEIVREMECSEGVEADEEPVGDEEADRFELPDWMKEAAAEAKRVEEGQGTRYLLVPKRDSRDGFRDMEKFIATVADEKLSERLENALQGRVPFRRFKDAVASDLRERERWFQYHDARVEEEVRRWLASEDIEPCQTS